MSRATLERELALVVVGTVVLAVDDLVRRHGLDPEATRKALRLYGHSFVEVGDWRTVGEDDPTVELDRETILAALQRADPEWKDEP